MPSDAMVGIEVATPHHGWSWLVAVTPRGLVFRRSFPIPAYASGLRMNTDGSVVRSGFASVPSHSSPTPGIRQPTRLCFRLEPASSTDNMFGPGVYLTITSDAVVGSIRLLRITPEGDILSIAGVWSGYLFPIGDDDHTHFHSVMVEAPL